MAQQSLYSVLSPEDEILDDEDSDKDIEEPAAKRKKVRSFRDHAVEKPVYMARVQLINSKYVL